VTHTCNPSYSGGWDHEVEVQGHRGKYSAKPYLENTQHTQTHTHTHTYTQDKGWSCYLASVRPGQTPVPPKK
jgi:hypothetical protein